MGGFFALHLVQQADAPGKKLAERLADRARPVTVSGAVVSEPKSSVGGFATFLLQLDSIEIGGGREACNATIRARWKGQPALGDEVRLTGMAEPVPPARNPGVFDMRSYLARRDVYQSLFARYPEDGAILATDGGNFILRLAAKSRAWMQAP
jgi:hypothetical protein